MAPKMMKPTMTGAHASGIFADMTVDGPEIGDLVVVIDRARNLPNRKTMGKQDPYCAARLGKEAKKTDTDRRGGQTPKWDQELRFTVHDSPDYFKLKLSVFNDDRKTDLIGETWIDLRDVVVRGGGQHDGWHALNCKGRAAGEVRMEITYYDTREREGKDIEEKPQRQAKETEKLRGPRDSNVKRRPLPADPLAVNVPSQRASLPTQLAQSRSGPRRSAQDSRLPRNQSTDATEDGPVDPYEHRHQMMAAHGLPFDPAAIKREGMMSYNGGPRPAPGQQGFTDLEKLSYRNRGLQLPESSHRADPSSESVGEVRQQPTGDETPNVRTRDLPAPRELPSHDRLVADPSHSDGFTDSIQRLEETNMPPTPASTEPYHQSRHHHIGQQQQPPPIFEPSMTQQQPNYIAPYPDQAEPRQTFMGQSSVESSSHPSWQQDLGTQVPHLASPQSHFQPTSPNFHSQTSIDPSYQAVSHTGFLHNESDQDPQQNWQAVQIDYQQTHQTHWPEKLESEDEGPPPPPPPHRSRSGPISTSTDPPHFSGSRHYSDTAATFFHQEADGMNHQGSHSDDFRASRSAFSTAETQLHHSESRDLRPLYDNFYRDREPEAGLPQQAGSPDHISVSRTVPAYEQRHPESWLQQSYATDRFNEQLVRNSQPLLSWPETNEYQEPQRAAPLQNYPLQASTREQILSMQQTENAGQATDEEPQSYVQYSEQPSLQAAPPLIKPRALSPRTSKTHYNSVQAVSDECVRIPRKSVSPTPSLSRRPSSPRLSGIAFSPDSFNVLNPKAAAHHERVRRERPLDGSDEKPTEMNDGLDFDEPIRDSTGQIVDPSDHLPSSTWAPEPETSRPVRQSDIKLRFRGAVPMPAAAPRARRPSVDLPEMRTSVQSPHITETPEPSLQSKPKTGKNKLQKRVRVLMTNGARPNTLGTNRQESNTALRDLQNFNSIPTSNSMTARELRNREVYGDFFTGGPPVPAKISLSEGQEENRMVEADTNVNDMDSLSREISSIDIGSGDRMRGKKTRFTTTLM